MAIHRPTPSSLLASLASVLAMAAVHAPAAGQSHGPLAVSDPPNLVEVAGHASTHVLIQVAPGVVLQVPPGPQPTHPGVRP